MQDMYDNLSIKYTCPMHTQIIQDYPGLCPICGMTLEPLQPQSDEKVNVELKLMSLRFWICLILLIPLLLLSMGMLIPKINQIIKMFPPHISSFLQAIFATPIVWWGAWPFFQRGWLSISNRSLNMFTLITLGIGIAYIYSLVGLLLPNLFPAAFQDIHGQIHLYFESAAVITVLVLLGQVLELKGREQTGMALQALLKLTPQFSHKIKTDNTEELTLVNLLHVDDHVRVKPGERVPLDGIVTAGHSTIDEAMISGESIPVEKIVNSKVIGGTHNLTGSFVMKIERVGKDTLLSQIIQQVAQAQRSKAPIQNLADLISSYFVPAVILIAIITFILWYFFGPNPSAVYGLISAISVLIIACPCALGLATPMSIMVGMGRAAQSGILIKDAESIERFEKVDTLVIDKTGTLTIGKPKVQNIITTEIPEEKLLYLAASLANNSEHPLSNAITEAAINKGIELHSTDNFHYEVGKGITGKINNEYVAEGNIKLIKYLNISPGHWKEKAGQFSQTGHTVLYIVVDDKIKGLIAISDTIKKNAQSVLKSLANEGISIIMLTGDNYLTAQAISKQLQITDFKAEVSPQDKNRLIQDLKKQKYIVAMAGDGINDAPALAEADVGIAMGNGTDIAVKSANITLVKGDLSGILRARILSKKVMHNIRQNLFLAFIYNSLCIPVAAGVLYPWTGILLNPMFAAAAMSLSSFSVIINSLRLRKI